MTSFDGLIWLLILLAPLLLLESLLHREVQAIFLLLTRRSEIALALFVVLFFPGVLLHEASHFLMARLLRVRTGRFSLLPRQLSDGRLLLGSVETARADWLRDALIGVAPLLSGGLFVAYAGLSRLNLDSLWAPLRLGDPQAVAQALRAVLNRPDFGLWFYLTFVVSSTMLPSSADRRAWLPLSLCAGLLWALALLAGAGPWMMAHLAAPLNRAFQAVALVFAVSLFVHLVLALPLVALRKLFSRLTGLQVVWPTG